MDGMFSLHILIKNENELHLKVIDKETGEEYTPVFIANSTGLFAGNVREECEQIIEDIINKCSKHHVYKGEYAEKIMEYVSEKYGTKLEFLWEETPGNSILRCKDNDKWYAALLKIEKAKLGFDEEGIIEIINLKETPNNVAELVDGKRYLQGYHMNKKHWYTMRLDGSVSIEEICMRIDVSYDLVASKGRRNETQSRPRNIIYK